MNIASSIEQNAVRFGDRPAVCFDDGTWSWREFHQRCCLIAERLRAAGVLPGQVIAQAITTESLQLATLLATARLGATAVTLPANMPEARKERLLREVAATLLVTEQAESLLAAVPVLVLKDGDDASPLPSAKVPAVEQPGVPWLIATGSGSTGQPKYLPISHEQQWARMRAGLAWLPYDKEDCLLSLIGLDFYAAKLRYLEAFAKGAAIYLPDRNALNPAAAAGRFSVLYGTVFHMEQLLQRSGGAAELASLKAVMVGGSSVSGRLRQRIRDELCERLYVLYGANECSTSCCTRLDSVFEASVGVGYPPPGFELQLVDPKGRPVATGEVGSVRIRSSTTIDGYLNDEKATARVFRDGWFYPGDLGRMDADGQLIHLGRSDDLMIVNGINVYPAEVENVLLDHPAVREVVTFPLPHPVHQDTPVALVARHAGAGATANELLHFARERLGAYALHHVFLCDRIPRNEQGKPRRDLIRQQIQARLRRPAAARVVAGRAELQDAPAPASPPVVEVGKVHDAKAPGVGRQPAMTLSLAFEPPGESSPMGVDAWLKLLGDDLPPPAPVSGGAGNAVWARCWLERYLRMARLFLHALQQPVFDTPRVLQCGPQSAEPLSKGRWRARLQLALVDLLPVSVYERVLQSAVRLGNWAADNSPTASNCDAFFATLNRHLLRPCARHVPRGKSAFQVLRAAHQLGVPFCSLGAGCYQLGWGARGQRIQRSSTGRDTTMGAALSMNKLHSASLLRAAGLPAPEHRRVDSAASALAAAERLGWPVVVKPADLERGEGVAVDVFRDGLDAAFQGAVERSPGKEVLVERQAPGICHRIFVSGGRLLYAVKRLPMSVTGDGRQTVAGLVAGECAAQRLLPPWHRSPIKPLDDLAREMLAAQGLDETSVPGEGARVALRRIESTAWGGVDEEVTATLHPENERIAVAAAALFGLDSAGVDIISPDITEPWYRNGAIINEVNYAPLLGGGEISRRYLPEFLSRLLDGDGRIPVEVFVGGDAAWHRGEARQRQLCAAGVAACLCSERLTFDLEGNELPMSFTGLYSRVRALVLFPWVDALILVVQTDELLVTGLPLDRVASVTRVDDSLLRHDDASAGLSPQRVDALAGVLAGWPSGG